MRTANQGAQMIAGTLTMVLGVILMLVFSTDPSMSMEMRQNIALATTLGGLVLSIPASLVAGEVFATTEN